MTRFVLVSSDGSFYIDPFTNKRAIFEDQKTAMITSMMLFSQQQRELKVEILK